MSNPASDALARINEAIDYRMEQIAKLLPANYKLTLIARNTDERFANADIVKSDDDFKLAVAALERLAHSKPL